MWMYVVCFCQCTRRCYSEVWGYLRLLETKDEVVGDSEDVENPASGRCAVQKKARGSEIPSCLREKEINRQIYWNQMQSHFKLCKVLHASR